MTVAPFVDAEQLAVVWLTQRLPETAISNRMPPGDAGVRVTRSPASSDADNVVVRVDVECFAADRTAMWILAGRVNNAMAELAGDVVELAGADDDVVGVQVDDVSTVTDPVPGYWSPTVERSVAVYELDIRPF